MDMDQHWNIQAEAYVKGQLSEKEVAAFEGEMRSNADLAEHVRVLRLETEAIDLLIDQELRAKIQSWQSEENVEDSTSAAKIKPFASSWVWLAAAVLVILALIFAWPNETQMPKVPEGPIAKEEPQATPDISVDSTQKEEPIIPPRQEAPQPVPGPDYERMAVNEFITAPQIENMYRSVGPEDSLSVLQKGAQAFREGAYSEAAEYLAQIDSATQADRFADILNLKGHIFFREGKYKAAANMFQQLANMKALPPAEKDAAEWALLMSLLPDFQANKSRIRALHQKMLDPDMYHGSIDAAKKLDIP